MTRTREVFARAESLAWWARASLGEDAPGIARELTDWRNRNTVALSDHALEVIATHVAAASIECERKAS